MPNPNAIVDTIVRVEPPLDKPPAEVLGESERGVTFEFPDGRRARLDRSDERAPALAGILEELRRRGKPVYIEVDPQTGVITRIQIPKVTHVEAMYANASGDVVIDIPLSHGSHVLRRQSGRQRDGVALERLAEPWLFGRDPDAGDRAQVADPGDRRHPLRARISRHGRRCCAKRWTAGCR